MLFKLRPDTYLFVWLILPSAAALGILECRVAYKDIRLSGLPAPLSLRDRYVSLQHASSTLCSERKELGAQSYAPSFECLQKGITRTQPRFGEITNL